MTATKKNYTDPELRERLKKEIVEGDKGGRPGQWSARKAQLLAHAYTKAGGGYTTDKAHEDAGAQHLDEWTDEEWTTADGAKAERGDTMARYLPKDAWEQLSPAQRRATEQAKREGDSQGQQYVANPPAAKAARKEVDAHHDHAASKNAASEHPHDPAHHGPDEGQKPRP